MYVFHFPDPTFIVKFEQNIVKYAEKMWKMWYEIQYTYKILEQNKIVMPTFSELKPETHIFIYALLLVLFGLLFWN